LIYDGIEKISGVGEARRKQLGRLGIFTVYDMLYFFPRRLEDRGNFKSAFELIDGETASVNVKALGAMQVRKIRHGFTVYTQHFQDESGVVNGVWYNNPYVKNAFKDGAEYALYGRVSAKYGKKEMITPVYEAVDANRNVGRIVPIYPLTGGMTQKIISSIMEKCLKSAGDACPETLPDYIRKRYSLCEIGYALANIHFPKDEESYEIARRRLVFEEFFTLLIGLFSLRGSRKSLAALPMTSATQEDFEKIVPFNLTGAQKRVLNEIYTDISRTIPMNRLVQGDVGSGKTMVAAGLIYAAAKEGMQSALMAPTEILATQHHQSLTSLFPDFKIALLTGSLSKKEKAAVLAEIESGKAQVVIGTHALIEDGVTFKSLGAVITDEQHRFGVRQRGSLAKKGMAPHVLVMSATPIPRTLSLIIYGDLDVSIIDELPPGRKPVETYIVNNDLRHRVYTFIKKEIDAGRQAYIVCPLVEENEKLDLKNAEGFAKSLTEKYFSPKDVAVMHGRLKSAEKEGIMSDFAAGKIRILVSTTVIEVGVNVPNSTIMVIENAERFGLSQLHQLRGRVGRGADKSYCFIFSESDNEITKKRLDIMKSTTDGFVVAEQDLKIRGPGEFFGTRQHGLPELRIANIFSDMNILSEASKAAKALHTDDPALSHPQNRGLRERVAMLFDNAAKEGSLMSG
jgi:ATP-dependent DNA helicase RecG